jgi:hypothetical protein
MSRVYVVRLQKSRMGDEKSPSPDLAFESVHAELERRRDLAASLCPNEQFLNRLTGDRGEKVLDARCAVWHAPNNKLELPPWAKLIVQTMQFWTSWTIPLLWPLWKSVSGVYSTGGCAWGRTAQMHRHPGLRLERTVSLDRWSDRLHSPITASRMAGETPCHRARTIEPQNSITLRPTPTPRPPRLTAKEII